jgi:hypothetical protein
MLENYSDFVEENCVFVDVGCFVGGTTVWGLVCLDGSAIRASACLFYNIKVELLVAKTLGVR